MLEGQKEGKSFQPSAMKEESFNTKKMRLQEPADFKKTFKAGNKIFSKSFHVYLNQNNYSWARLGVNVAKRVVSKASKRNNIKRKIREKFRRRRYKNYDIVFVLKKYDVDLINEEIEYVFKEIDKKT